MVYLGINTKAVFALQGFTADLQHHPPAQRVAMSVRLCRNIRQQGVTAACFKLGRQPEALVSQGPRWLLIAVRPGAVAVTAAAAFRGTCHEPLPTEPPTGIWLRCACPLFPCADAERAELMR